MTIYYAYKISDGSFIRSNEFYDEVPPDVSHKDVEWRIDAPVEPELPVPTAEEIRQNKLFTISNYGVKMASARKCLIINGHLSTVNAALASITGIEGELARAAFEYEIIVRMNDPIALSMKGVLSLTDTQYEDLFIQAYDLG